MAFLITKVSRSGRTRKAKAWRTSALLDTSTSWSTTTTILKYGSATKAAIAACLLATLHGWCLAMVRADTFGSVVEVVTSGPRLPWVTSLWRAGDAYLPVVGSPSLLSLPFFALAAAVLAWIWTRDPPARGSGA